MADGGGFEPPVSFPTHAFQACTIDRSVTHPLLLRRKTGFFSSLRRARKSSRGRVVARLGTSPSNHGRSMTVVRLVRWGGGRVAR